MAKKKVKKKKPLGKKAKALVKKPKSRFSLEQELLEIQRLESMNDDGGDGFYIDDSDLDFNL